MPALDVIAPSSIFSLAADSVSSTTIAVHWFAPGDDGKSGTADGYEMQVTTVPSEAGSFASGLVGGLPAPGAAGTLETFLISGLSPATFYYVAVRAYDAAGNRGLPSNVLGVATDPGGSTGTGSATATLRSRFQPSRLPAELEWSASVGYARALRLYDVGGREIRELAVPSGASGVIQWDGHDADGRAVRAGLYFARLTNGSARADARIVLIP
jgi:hypothetical protein